MLFGGVWLYGQQQLLREEIQDERVELQAERQRERDELQKKQDELAAEQDRLEREQADLSQQQETLQAAQPIDPEAVAAAVMPSVVTVFCGGYPMGSGFAYEATAPGGFQSMVVSNAHVVDACYNEDLLPVQVGQNGTYYAAEPWAADRDNDLASIAVEGYVPALALGFSPGIGEEVLAVGSPMGLEGSVTRGVVSRVDDDMIQTDTAINPGNSGGPLVNKEGELVGIVTSKLAHEQIEGIGFAVRGRHLYNELFVRG